MVRLNTSRYLFQLVCDAGPRLHGTVTDGDIRRALLRGASLDAPVEVCMQKEFLAGRAGADRENQLLLRAGRRRVAFLPVLDGDGRLVEVLVRDIGEGAIARALVMAGGFGRRLGARTQSVPKPLLPVGGRPILDHVLEALEDAGIAEIHVSLHYLAHQIRAFVGQRANRARVQFIEEETPLGTVGAAGRLDGGGKPGPLLIINGDVITRTDFAALRDFHVRHGLDGTIGVARHEIEVPFGVVRYGEDGLFAGIDEKPRISNFIAAGIYYLSPEFVALVPGDRPMDMPELLNLGKKIGLRIGLFPIHEYWTDVGRPDDLAAAEDATRAGAPIHRLDASQ
jgi:NDP-sugar pyrophosphorylase family protein